MLPSARRCGVRIRRFRRRNVAPCAQALELCKVWALADPGTVGPYFSMARVDQAMGKPDEARNRYHKIIEMDPEGRSAASARKTLETN